MSDFRLGDTSGNLPVLALNWYHIATGTSVADYSRPLLRKFQIHTRFGNCISDEDYAVVIHNSAHGLETSILLSLWL